MNNVHANFIGETITQLALQIDVIRKLDDENHSQQAEIKRLKLRMNTMYGPILSSY